jgi:hypothetical protein
MEFHGKIHGIPWNFMEFHGIHGISWNSVSTGLIIDQHQKSIKIARLICQCSIMLFDCVQEMGNERCCFWETGKTKKLKNSKKLKTDQIQLCLQAVFVASDWCNVII